MNYSYKSIYAKRFIRRFLLVELFLGLIKKKRYKKKTYNENLSFTYLQSKFKMQSYLSGNILFFLFIKNNSFSPDISIRQISTRL